MDFFHICYKVKSNGTYEIYPKFIIASTNDLMIRGGEFYAAWIEEIGLWSTNEWDVIKIIDREIDRFVKDNQAAFEDHYVSKLYMHDADSGSIDRWHKYCQKQMPSSWFRPLDEEITFANDEATKEKLASKRLPYALSKGSIENYDALMSVLYTPEERRKLEWAIGSIVAGDSKWIQKFIVLYGSAGSGKSTVLNIITKLFEPYVATFDAKALGNPNSVFALEPFSSNPLVAIQHDGDLSHIEDNARLNSLVSHEALNVNEKFKKIYTMEFKAMLFVGTNKPVKITDAKSGLLRRLIDVTPSGETVPKREYNRLVKGIDFELGAIAYHCLSVYNRSPGYYDDYVPTNMVDATNDFYNFVADSYFTLLDNDPIQLQAVWTMYKEYVQEANLSWSMNKRAFKEELKNYYEKYEERGRLDGRQARNVYSGFKHQMFDETESAYNGAMETDSDSGWLVLSGGIRSKFDTACADCKAQYATNKGAPKRKWANVDGLLSGIDTSRLHYVKPLENHIVIDFDLKGPDGSKSLEANIAEANKWPKTYAECSKSGQGLHLHYIYDGDVTQLSSIYDENVEIKVFTGNSALRRKLTMCNDLDIAHLSGGLPVKERKELKMIEGTQVMSERALRTLIIRNLRKEIHPATKPSVEFIKKILDDAYASDLAYDVTDMKDDIMAFAAHSTNNAKYCMSVVREMRFASREEMVKMPDNPDEKIVFFDIEIFPNLFVICFKVQGSEEVLRLINPTAEEVRQLLKMPLVGFNNRDYDNHMVWYASQGYSVPMLFEVSQNIIGKGIGKNANAYNLSYADVYEFVKKKQSLKKWEIELGIRHNELGLPWDKPVDKRLWKKVADYCCDDVRATEAVFEARHGDFVVKQVLAKMAGGCVNDSTTQLTNKIIFGNNRHPQNEFNYRWMGAEEEIEYNLFEDEWATFNKNDQPIFKGYTFKNGKSEYRGEEVGEGGYVYAEPGCYADVALLDIASMHPSTIEAEQLFGPYTKRFCDLKYGRITLKHINQMIKNGAPEEEIAERIEAAKRDLFDGDLAEFLDNRDDIAALPDAFKLVINKVYGLTKARFENPFRDDRNVDNIVAKRGALFMVNLKNYVQGLGYTVAHIKTDSIKIPNADAEIIEKVMDYGKAYGYTFEHEATYERMVLVNDAVYIAKDKADNEWHPTGKQFAVPYVYKKMFGNPDDITTDDLAVTFASKGAIYLDLNDALPDDTELLKQRDKLLKACTEDDVPEKLAAIDEEISKCHNYKFIGRVGQFSPVVDEMHGGRLMVSQDEIKYSYAPGAKGYRWMETADLESGGNMDKVDISYFDALVDDAIKAIEVYCPYDVLVDEDFEKFKVMGVEGFPFY